MGHYSIKEMVRYDLHPAHISYDYMNPVKNIADLRKLTYRSALGSQVNVNHVFPVRLLCAPCPVWPFLWYITPEVVAKCLPK